VRAPLADLPATLSPEKSKIAAATIVFVETAERRAAELVPRAQAWQPDVVLSETMELTGVAVAAWTGARHVVHGIGLAGPAGWQDFPAFA
jgi:hypothetical protein